MYALVLMTAVLATASALDLRSCAHYCISLKRNRVAMHRPECVCSLENKRYHYPATNDHHKPLSVSVFDDSAIYYAPVPDSYPYPSISFAENSFYIVNPAFQEEQTKHRNDELTQNNKIHDLSKSPKSLHAGHRKNKNKIRNVQKQMEKEVPLYLDIDISNVYSDGQSSENKAIDNFSLSENDLIECIDLHIIVFSRKTEVDNEWLDIWDENKIKKYENLSDSDLLIEIQNKCHLPHNIVKESVEEISRSRPKKSKTIPEHNDIMQSANNINNQRSEPIGSFPMTTMKIERVTKIPTTTLVSVNINTIKNVDDLNIESTDMGYHKDTIDESNEWTHVINNHYRNSVATEYNNEEFTTVTNKEFTTQKHPTASKTEVVSLTNSIIFDLAYPSHSTSNDVSSTLLDNEHSHHSQIKSTNSNANNSSNSHEITDITGNPSHELSKENNMMMDLDNTKSTQPDWPSSFTDMKLVDVGNGFRLQTSKTDPKLNSFYDELPEITVTPPYAFTEESSKFSTSSHMESDNGGHSAQSHTFQTKPISTDVNGNSNLPVTPSYQLTEENTLINDLNNMNFTHSYWPSNSTHIILSSIIKEELTEKPLISTTISYENATQNTFTTIPMKLSAINIDNGTADKPDNNDIMLSFSTTNDKTTILPINLTDAVKSSQDSLASESKLQSIEKASNTDISHFMNENVSNDEYTPNPWTTSDSHNKYSSTNGNTFYEINNNYDSSTNAFNDKKKLNITTPDNIEKHTEIYNNLNLTNGILHLDEIKDIDYKKNDDNLALEKFTTSTFTPNLDIAKTYLGKNLATNVFPSADFTTESKNTHEKTLSNKNERRASYPENQLSIPRIVTKELPNNTVVSDVNGIESIPNNDFSADSDHPENYNSDHHSMRDTTIASTELHINPDNIGINDIHDNRNYSSEETGSIVGKLYFIFEERKIPARFVQDRDGHINLGIDGKSLCDKLLENQTNKSIIMGALCKCSQSQNCANALDDLT